MSTTLEAARAYVAAGLSVIPIERGGKLPDHWGLQKTTGQAINWVASDERAAWRTYCTRMPTDAELVTWFAASDAGVGIVGGAISGGLVRIDFESAACLLSWAADLVLRDPALANAAYALPVVQTGKGHHVYLRMPDPPGHVILSSCDSGSDLLVLAETQGEGCYCVAPPSPVPGSGEWSSDPRAVVYTRHYEWGATAFWAPFTAIPTFDTAIAGQLLDAARFAGFWTHRLQDYSDASARVHRGGITLERTIASHSESWYLPWDAVAQLRTFLSRYDALLQSVEAAPPPPPSYDIWEEGDDE